MNIYLIGMPYSGKSTVGRVLAEMLNYEFVDLDEEIEMSERRHVSDIVLKDGEKSFRKLESRMLAKTAQRLKQGVISCGGGIVTRRVNRIIMAGAIVFLLVDIEVLKERTKTSYERPLLRNKTLEELYAERNDRYMEYADYVVPANGNADAIARMIIERVGYKL